MNVSQRWTGRGRVPALLGAGLALAGLWQAGPLQAAERLAGSAPALQVLQSIQPGLWKLESRTEPPSQTMAAEAGCITSERMAGDLQELLEQVQAGQLCTVTLPQNTRALGVLELHCSREGRAWMPAVMEIRSHSPQQFSVSSRLQPDPGQPSMQLLQDYQWAGACPP